MPFLAGVGAMRYRKFLVLDVIGGLLWISIFTFAGYFFGSMEWVEKRFSLVILAVIAISLLPGLVEYVRHRLGQRNGGPAADEA
jgi:membrane-associated protein